MTTQSHGTTAVRALAAIRLVNGTLGLLAPQVLVRRTSADPTAVSRSAPVTEIQNRWASH